MPNNTATPYDVGNQHTPPNQTSAPSDDDNGDSLSMHSDLNGDDFDNRFDSNDYHESYHHDNRQTAHINQTHINQAMDNLATAWSDNINSPTSTDNPTNTDSHATPTPNLAPITKPKAQLPEPHNIGIEQALLAALMNLENSFDVIEGIIYASDFYGERHRVIFDVIAHLSRSNQPYDSLSVFESLQRQELLEKAGGESYLMTIDKAVGTMFNLPYYAQKIQELSTYRKLIACGNNILAMAYHPKQKTLRDILDHAEAQIFAINEAQRNKGGKQGVKSAREVLGSVVDDIQQRLAQGAGAMIGLPTRFEELDNKTQGLQKGHLVVLAARPSMGKTALSLNIAQSVLEQELPVVFFSMEMSANDIAMRMISAWSGIAMGSVRSGLMQPDEWGRFNNAVTRLTNSKLYIDDRNNTPPSEIRSVCRRIAKDNQGMLGLIVVDYLQLMRAPGFENNRVGEISEISRSLKSLARELDCPVLALAQLNRSLEQRPSKRPVMSDLRESGAIEQDADIILFIYRDEVYFPDKKGNKGIAEIIIGKNRSGAIGRAFLNFEGMYTRFSNPSLPVKEDYDQKN